MQGEDHIEQSSQAGELFGRLIDYQRRSLEHEVGDAGQQQISNWDGVVFRLGDFHLTCRIEQVEEVIAFPAYTPIPGSKDWLLGIANVRGNLAPISDLGWYLFGTRTPVTARTRLILTKLQGRLAGLVVDEVFGQRHFHTDDLNRDEEWDQTPMKGLVTHVFETNERRWGVFNMETLVKQREFTVGARQD